MAYRSDNPAGICIACCHYLKLDPNAEGHRNLPQLRLELERDGDC